MKTEEQQQRSATLDLLASHKRRCLVTNLLWKTLAVPLATLPQISHLPAFNSWDLGQSEF